MASLQINNLYASIYKTKSILNCVYVYIIHHHLMYIYTLSLLQSVRFPMDNQVAFYNLRSAPIEIAIKYEWV